jgi:short-chain fatty acids transporter
MQMCLIMITGDVLANAPVIKRFITRVAKVPKNQLQALVLLSIIVFITRWIHWDSG